MIRPQPQFAPMYCNVVVPITYFGCENSLRQAVESILNQTMRDFILIIVNDGDKDPWHTISEIKDNRLFSLNLLTNRGTYFANELAIRAVRANYVMIQDADDWSEPTRLERLYQAALATGAPYVGSAEWLHSSRKIEVVSWVDQVRSPLEVGNFEGNGLHHGLFRTDALKAIGGYYGGLRVNYDSYIMSMVKMIGALEYVEFPLYHRILRDGSLTSSPDTGFDSRQRALALVELQQRYDYCFEKYSSYLTGSVSKADLLIHISSMMRARTPKSDRESLDLLGSLAGTTIAHGVNSPAFLE